jgi:hypothetical protein
MQDSLLQLYLTSVQIVHWFAFNLLHTFPFCLLLNHKTTSFDLSNNTNVIMSIWFLFLNFVLEIVVLPISWRGKPHGTCSLAGFKVLI